MERVAVLSYIWRFYRFNPLALHTVVRNTAHILLGPLGKMYSHATAAIWGVAAITIALAVGFSRNVTVAKNPERM